MGFYRPSRIPTSTLAGAGLTPPPPISQRKIEKMKTATLTASFQLEIVSIEEDNPFFDYLETYAGKEKCIAEENNSKRKVGIADNSCKEKWA